MCIKAACIFESCRPCSNYPNPRKMQWRLLAFDNSADQIVLVFGQKATIQMYLWTNYTFFLHLSVFQFDRQLFIKSNCANVDQIYLLPMMFSVYKAIWVLLHTIFNIKDFVQQLLFIGKSKCSALWKGKQKANLPHDKYLIEQYKSCMKKIPQHLAVILGTEEPNFEALSKIVFWGLAAGIQHISFYDHKGNCNCISHSTLMPIYVLYIPYALAGLLNKLIGII